LWLLLLVKLFWFFLDLKEATTPLTTINCPL